LQTAPELSRKADGMFYGNVIHRVLELKIFSLKKDGGGGSAI